MRDYWRNCTHWRKFNLAKEIMQLCSKNCTTEDNPDNTTGRFVDGKWGVTGIEVWWVYEARVFWMAASATKSSSNFVIICNSNQLCTCAALQILTFVPHAWAACVHPVRCMSVVDGMLSWTDITCGSKGWTCDCLGKLEEIYIYRPMNWNLYI